MVTFPHRKTGRIIRTVESGDSAARRVWDRKSVWSQAADAAREGTGRARTIGLTLGIAAAALSTLGSQILAWQSTLGRTLVLLAAASAGLAPTPPPGRFQPRCGMGETAGGFAEDGFGEDAAAVVLRQGGGVALDVGGDRAGVPDDLEGGLLVVAGREVRVLPREDSGDELSVRPGLLAGSGRTAP